MLDNPTGDLPLDFLVGIGEGPTQLVQHVVLQIKPKIFLLTITVKEPDTYSGVVDPDNLS